MINPFYGSKIKLEKSDSELVQAFHEMKRFEDVANLLEITEHALWIVLVKNKLNNYKQITIPKKNGEERTVYLAHNDLSIIQHKLKYVLELLFVPHFTAHGFVKEKSIVTNAATHVNKNFVINIDLENFFDTIKYQRIVNMFIKYFKCNLRIAHTLSNIIVHPLGHLPQGSCLSPLISNVIAKSMDKQLFELCKDIGEVQYTRYADDLTFSTNRKRIPHNLASTPINSSPQISEVLRSIIENNGFSVNEAKFRIQTKFDHQSVTGIKVNHRLNVNKKYIRDLRMYLHMFERTMEIDVAIKDFNKRRDIRTKFYKNIDKNWYIAHHFRVLKGMIEFVGFVRGRRDQIFNKFSKRYNNICTKFEVENLFINIPILFNEKLKDKILIIGNGNVYNYTLDCGITDKNIILPTTLAINTFEKGLITFSKEWEGFVFSLKNTPYFDFYTIPVFSHDGANRINNSRIIDYSSELNLMKLEFDLRKIQNNKDDKTYIRDVENGNAFIVGLQQGELEIFPGILSERTLFNEKKFVFSLNSNETLPISTGFVFNQETDLIGVLQNENNVLYVHSLN